MRLILMALAFLPIHGHSAEDPVATIVISGLSMLFQIGMLIFLMRDFSKGRALAVAFLVYFSMLAIWWAYSLQLADVSQKILGLSDVGVTVAAFFAARYVGRKLLANGG